MSFPPSPVVGEKLRRRGRGRIGETTCPLPAVPVELRGEEEIALDRQRPPEEGGDGVLAAADESEERVLVRAEDALGGYAVRVAERDAPVFDAERPAADADD